MITEEADFFKIKDLKNIIIYQFDAYIQMQDEMTKLKSEIAILEKKSNFKKINLEALEKIADRDPSARSTNKSNINSTRSKQ